jgi:hypothetical protein
MDTPSTAYETPNFCSLDDLARKMLKVQLQPLRTLLPTLHSEGVPSKV